MIGLLNEKHYIAGPSWTNVLHKLKSYPSVVKAEYLEMTSSAGDWSGYILQKLNKKYYLLAFSQEARWPKTGYNVWTGGIEAKFNHKPDEDEIWEVMKKYY